MATKKGSSKTPETKVPGVEPKPETVEVEKDTALIFKAKGPLTPGQFKTLSNMLKHEQEATGLKIVLVPFSAEQATE